MWHFGLGNYPWITPSFQWQIQPTKIGCCHRALGEKKQIKQYSSDVSKASKLSILWFSLPLQSTSWQLVFSWSGPRSEQSFPPIVGVGLVQYRFLVMMPCPQVTEHGVHRVHSLKLPLTGDANTAGNKNVFFLSRSVLRLWKRFTTTSFSRPWERAWVCHTTSWISAIGLIVKGDTP